jgi:serine/threonine protein kinase
MGEVYRARDPRLDRDVAIKVLPADVCGHPQALARFEREAKAVAALSHPNILAIFDVGSADGRSYVVTELLEGETLRARLNAGALAWRKAAEMGIAISEGLAAAHSKGVIHRDIKPDNLFLTRGLRVCELGRPRQDSGLRSGDHRARACRRRRNRHPGHHASRNDSGHARLHVA